ncbi:MAG: hypothetical protein IJ486_02940 [Firmicutes bacterium]|nr:hypothetical protein [Bacillota bacterium]
MEYAEKAEFTEVKDRNEREIVFHIVEHIGVLSETKGWKRELNVVSWNGMPPKFDIREWDEYHELMRKGITLTKGEMRELYNILAEVDFTKVEVPETRSRRKREEPVTAAERTAETAVVETTAAAEGSSEAIPF